LTRVRYIERELGAYLSRGALGSASLAETALEAVWSRSVCVADVSLAYSLVALLQEIIIFFEIPAASAMLLATWVRTVAATAGPLAEEHSCCMAAPVEEAAAATILIPEEAICWDF
jgi:hypothetical protein